MGMVRATFGIITCLAASATVFAQAAPPRAEFEVASIRPWTPAPGTQVTGGGVHIDGAQVTCVGMSLRDYIRMAYDLKPFEVSGPDWLASERFDLSAKFPDSSQRGKLREMVLSLLEARFGLKTHREKKDLPVYALAVAKGGFKMKEVVPDPASAAPPDPNKPYQSTGSGSAAGINIDLGNGALISFANNRLEGRKLTMPQFSLTLTTFTDRPVIDATGLTGKYDFAVDISPEDYRAMMIRAAINNGANLPPQALALLDQGNGDSLIGALESALGLKLDSRKAPIDMLVVDHMEKAPSEN